MQQRSSKTPTLRLWLAPLIAVVTCLATTGTSTATAGQPQSRTNESITCSHYRIPVHLSPHSPKTYSVYGQWCHPKSYTPAVVQLLVHGFTYTHTYWNFPGFHGKYSYRNRMNHAGYGTFAIDRIGNGKSSHPDGAKITVDTNRNVLHDVVQWMRNGGLPGKKDRKIISVGHSYGTAVVYREAARYQDVDGVVGTGALHIPGAVGLGELATYTRPAAKNNRLRHKTGLDPMYVTTTNAGRSIFYNKKDADPAVIAADARQKDTYTVPELATVAKYVLPTVTPNIHVPTLVAAGQRDKIHCLQGNGAALESCANSQTLKRAEQPLWSSDAHLQTYVLPKAGHSINLAKNAPAWYGRALKWFREFFPVSD